MLPAKRLGGLLLTRPTSGGGATPMLPKNGFERHDDAREELRGHAPSRSSATIFWPTLRSQFSGRKPAQPL